MRRLSGTWREKSRRTSWSERYVTVLVFSLRCFAMTTKCGFVLVVLLALFVAFCVEYAPPVAHAQPRALPGTEAVKITPVETLTVIGVGTNPKDALHDAHAEAALYATAVGSSWGRTLRRVSAINELQRSGSQGYRVTVTFELAEGIRPEQLVKEE
jgi:hypothetical protein